MKTKFLGVVAACVFALSVGDGAANATTFNINPFLELRLASCSVPLPCGGVAGLFGTVDINNGIVTSVNISSPIALVDNPYYGIQPVIPNVPFFSFSYDFITQSPGGSNGWDLVLGGLNTFCSGGAGNCNASSALRLNFDVPSSGTVLAISGAEQVAGLQVCLQGSSGGFSDCPTLFYTFRLTTPLPAALPLFATGLGALGLLGWRRKKKAQATAA